MNRTFSAAMVFSVLVALVLATPARGGGDCAGAPAGSPCDDGDACTIGDECDGFGNCISGDPAECNDGDACTIDSCDPAIGCQNTFVDCNDGNLCTEDLCDPVFGCDNTPSPQGSPCDDGDKCTVNDTCDGMGNCVSGPPTGCDDCTYDNSIPLDDFGSPASQKDIANPFYAEAADDFVLTGNPANGCVLSEVQFATTFFNTPGGLPVDPLACWAGVNITIYEDAQEFCGPGFLKGPAGEPIDAPPFDHIEYCPNSVVCEIKVPLANVNVVPVTTTCTPDFFSFDVTVSGLEGLSCVLEKNHKYWIAIAPEMQFAVCGQTAIRLSTDVSGQPAQSIFLLLAIPWTVLDGNADACPPVTPPIGTAVDLAIRVTATKETDCEWDFDASGDVGITDLLEVLGFWGNPYNINDLLALLAAWGPC